MSDITTDLSEEGNVSQSLNCEVGRHYSDEILPLPRVLTISELVGTNSDSDDEDTFSRTKKIIHRWR